MGCWCWLSASTWTAFWRVRKDVMLPDVVAQCFDLDNFLEINSRLPSWKCPVASCPRDLSMMELRLDAHMQQILEEIEAARQRATGRSAGVQIGQGAASRVMVSLAVDAHMQQILEEIEAAGQCATGGSAVVRSHHSCESREHALMYFRRFLRRVVRMPLLYEWNTELPYLLLVLQSLGSAPLFA